MSRGLTRVRHIGRPRMTMLMCVLDASRDGPTNVLLRLRLPEGWQVAGAQIGGTILPLKGGDAADLSGQRGKLTVRFQLRKVVR